MTTPTDPQASTRGGLLSRTLRRRWLSIFSRWTLLTVALMCAAWVVQKPVYRASALLRVDPTAADLYNLKANQDEKLTDFLQTQVQLVTSPNVLTAAGTNPKAAALSRIQVAGDVAQELRKVIQVSVLPGTYLIEVGMESRSAFEAATLVNAVVDSYMNSASEWSDGMTRTQIKNLDTYLSDLKNQTEELDRRWKELVKRSDLKQQIKANTPNDADYRKRLRDRQIDNELALLQAQTRLEAFKNQGGKDQARLEDLEFQVQAATLFDKALAARLQSASDVAAAEGAVDVDLVVIKESRENLMKMQATVQRRLEQLRFEARGEARVRQVSAAYPPGRPVRDVRPWVMGVIPFLTFFTVLGWFVGVEARSLPLAGASATESPTKPEPAGE